ncbi:hypothetical protein BDY19DRAFT_327483 [Irpex rosettiformis]|uniref:Uncharacterized protein n=1 Tax=Irpex rosettiformis TaxID=378272 RepID=A0ACB8TXE9_9APHY|nr:hypothetical protein BDY19DRAFT_327483 [Irpex rosettiformis]
MQVDNNFSVFDNGVDNLNWPLPFPYSTSPQLLGEASTDATLFSHSTRHPTTLVIIPRPDNGSPTPRKYASVPAIDFWVEGRQGLRLIDALQGNFAGLAGPGHEVMNAVSTKVSYKVEWIGYKPLSKQKYARRVKGRQSRSKIARQVAEIVSEFVNDRARCQTSQPLWRIGRGSIEYANLYLMEIKRVSKSTWVPVLAYAV